MRCVARVMWLSVWALVLLASGVAGQAPGSLPCVPAATADTLVPTNPGIAGLTGQPTDSASVAAAAPNFIRLGCSERVTVFTQTQPYTGPNSTVPNGVPGVAPQVDTWPRANCPHLAADLTPFEAAIPNVVANGSYVVATGQKLLLRSCSLPAASQTDAAFILTRITVQSGAMLVLDDSPLTLRVREIRVDAGGQLLAGSATCRLFSKIQIVFHGSAATSAGFGDTTGRPQKGLLSSGIAAFHGKLYHPTWTRLARTVTPTRIPTSVMNDSSIIYLQEAVNWEVGQQIVVTTSILFDCGKQWSAAWCLPQEDRWTRPSWPNVPVQQQNEIRTIVGLAHAPHLPSDSNSRFTALKLNQSLSYVHWGGQEYQSEVVLLSRRIQMDGEESNDQFGGHIRVQGSNSEGRFAGVAGNNLGQLNQMGRYPFHFHMMGDSARTAASYIEDCSVTNTQFRCFVIHGTNRTRLSRNTAFNAIGSCYYLEDGVEERNLLEYNFAGHVHPIFRPADGGGGQGGEKFTSSPALIIPADTAAGAFYALNAYNSWVGNAASGGWTGFSFPNTPYRMGDHKGTLGPDATSPVPLNPMARPLLRFIGNTAHSAGAYWNGHGSCMYVGGWFTSGTDGVLTYSSGRSSRSTMLPDRTAVQMLFEHTKVWMCNKGIAHWGNQVTVTNAEIHDVRMGTMLFGRGVMSDVLINARTANDPIVPVGQGINGYSDVHLAREQRGYQFYDTSSKSLLSGVIFRNFKKSRDAFAIAPLFHSDHYTPQGINSVRGLKFENTDPEAYYLNNHCPLATCRNKLVTTSSTINMAYDFDGSFSGTGQPSIVGSWSNWWNHSPETDCRWNGNLTVWTCDWKERSTAVYFTPMVNGLSDCTPEMGCLNDHIGGFTVGRISQWGTDTTRGHDMSPFASSSTGHSNTGWYWRSKASKFGVDGAPSAFKIHDGMNMPRNHFVVLAVTYPSHANFTVRIRQNAWSPGSSMVLPMANSLATVLAPTELLKPSAQFTCAADRASICTNTGGSGPSWYFDSASGYLYLRVVNIGCYTTGRRASCESGGSLLAQDGISVPAWFNGFHLEVEADCESCVVQSTNAGVTFWEAPDVAPATRFPTNWGNTRTNAPAMPSDSEPIFTQCAAAPAPVPFSADGLTPVVAPIGAAGGPEPSDQEPSDQADSASSGLTGNLALLIPVVLGAALVLALAAFGMFKLHSSRAAALATQKHMSKQEVAITTI